MTTHFRNVVTDLISKKRKLDVASSPTAQHPNTQDSSNQDLNHPAKVIKVDRNDQPQQQPNTQPNNETTKPHEAKLEQTKPHEAKLEQTKPHDAKLEQTKPREVKFEQTKLEQTEAQQVTPSCKEQEKTPTILCDATNKQMGANQTSRETNREYSCECMKFFVVRINQLLSILSQIVSSKSYAYQFKVGLARTKFNSEFCDVPDTVRSVWNMSDQQKQKAQSYMSIWHKAAATKVQDMYAVHDVLSNESVPALDAVNIIVGHIQVLKTVGLDEMALTFEPANLAVVRKLLVSLCALVMHTK